MKEKSHTSKKDRHRKNGEERNGDKYSNILKEKHYKDDYNAKKDLKNDHKSKSPDKYKNKHAKSPDRSLRRKNNKHSSRGSEKHKNHRKEDIYEDEESYEELSRKKRKIESELQELDLQEAKANKHHTKDDKKPKNRPIKVKEEPASDDDSRSSKSKTRHPNSSSEKQRPPAKDETRWGLSKEETKKVEKEKPNFEVSGKLAEDTNVYNGVVIKYNEPGEARKPQRRWRLYPFKGDSDLPFIPIHRQSAYLFGRTRSIADIPIDHPSCSKQHAVLQYRLVPYTREDGTKGRRVRPYVIDLESSNGTFVNNKRIDARCYVELIEKDVIKFGYSSREYVILHEESKNDFDDDVKD